MMKLRLTRTGAKNDPHYRVVCLDHRAQRDGKFLEVVGIYDPRQNPPLVKLKFDRIDYWLARGARTSETVGQILKRARKAQAAAAPATPA